MSRIYLLNAFSLNMLHFDEEQEFVPPMRVVVSPMSPKDAARVVQQAYNNILAPGFPRGLNLHAHIGHESTAALLSKMLNIPLHADRATVTMLPGDIAIVAQYVGPRLPEGATSLPEGATIRFYLVEVE